MDIDVFMEAKELYDRYKLCEGLMQMLSDPDSPKSYKYRKCLADFVEAFMPQFMEFLQSQIEATGMAFEEVSDCKCEEKPDEPDTPEEPGRPDTPEIPVEPENPDENGGASEPGEGE